MSTKLENIADKLSKSEYQEMHHAFILAAKHIVRLDKQNTEKDMEIDILKRRDDYNSPKKLAAFLQETHETTVIQVNLSASFLLYMHSKKILLLFIISCSFRRIISINKRHKSRP